MKISIKLHLKHREEWGGNSSKLLEDYQCKMAFGLTFFLYHCPLAFGLSSTFPPVPAVRTLNLELNLLETWFYHLLPVTMDKSLNLTESQFPLGGKT